MCRQQPNYFLLLLRFPLTSQPRAVLKKVLPAVSDCTSPHKLTRGPAPHSSSGNSSNIGLWALPMGKMIETIRRKGGIETPPQKNSKKSSAEHARKQTRERICTESQRKQERSKSFPSWEANHIKTWAEMPIQSCTFQSLFKIFTYSKFNTLKNYTAICDIPKIAPRLILMHINL